MFDIFVCMFCFMFVLGLVLWTDLRSGLYIWEVLKRVLMTESDCPEVTLCG